VTAIEGLAQRLKYARERAGLTQSEASARSEVGESSLSEFEHGKREPSVSQLAALATAYNRPMAFFLMSGPPPAEVVRWRKKPKAAEAIEVLFLRLCEQYQNLESWCGATVATTLPAAEPPSRPFGRHDAEQLAIRVRRELELGACPGPALLNVLEEQCGVKVFHLDIEPQGTAASSQSAGFGNAVLLNKKNPKWRRNFDLAHELFHLLTWNFGQAKRPAGAVWSESDEKLADEFAACLLMPADAVLEAVGHRLQDRKLPLVGLFEIARQFDVSVEALTWRIHRVYGGKPKDKPRTEAMIERARAAATLFEERTQDDPPQRPARFVALALKALRGGDLSVGRFAEYVGTTRQRALEIPDQEPGDNDALELPPP
jgi:Zn-dependent peptidase ImmA (M78 family)/DNA-binding XRE family transcriptional regulator